MSDKVEVQSHGLGIGSILTIIFVVVKLFHVVNWSWWVVFSPLIVSMALVVMILMGVLVAAGIALWVASR